MINLTIGKIYFGKLGDDDRKRQWVFEQAIPIVGTNRQHLLFHCLKHPTIKHTCRDNEFFGCFAEALLKGKSTNSKPDNCDDSRFETTSDFMKQHNCTKYVIEKLLNEHGDVIVFIAGGKKYVETEKLNKYFSEKYDADLNDDKYTLPYEEALQMTGVKRSQFQQYIANGQLHPRTKRFVSSVKKKLGPHDARVGVYFDMAEIQNLILFLEVQNNACMR